jgi:hypothetical protein
VLFLNELEEILELLGADQLMQVHDNSNFQTTLLSLDLPSIKSLDFRIQTAITRPFHAGPYTHHLPMPIYQPSNLPAPVLQIREQLFRLIAKCLGSNHFQVTSPLPPLPPLLSPNILTPPSPLCLTCKRWRSAPCFCGTMRTW